MQKILALIALSGLFWSAQLYAQDSRHPLDPLNWQEYWTVLEVLREVGHLDSKTRFSMVNLKEPAKDLVRQWSPGERIPRSAYALVRQGKKSFETVVDLAERSLLSWEELEGAQPNWLGEEFRNIVSDVKKHPDFIAAMARRGIDDLTFIDCFVMPAGYFGTDEQRGRRIGHVVSHDSRGVRNTFTRQIEGLTVVVDLIEGEILRVVDEGVVRIPTVSADYDAASIGPTRPVPGPIQVNRPQGQGFTLNGYQVSWQKWRFHVRPDQRVGMIISDVTYTDGDERRSVLYQANLSEIFVPYMDPAFNWYARNFIDAGEYSSGGLTKPLLQGLDCPDYAVYLSGLIAGDNGRPIEVPRMIGLFERETGDVSWRHRSESRIKRDLVVRIAAVIGNYDYFIDWIFQQDGSIRVAVGATGIVEVKMVNQEKALAAEGSPSGGSNGANVSIAAEAREAADRYGRFVAPQIVAVNHDHYFSFRLDLDVDGTSNSLVVDRLKAQSLPEGHPRRSLWVRDPMLARTEADAKLNISLDNPALWRVISSSRTNHVGYPTSYQIMPGKNISTLLSRDDYPRRRAGFIDHHLWVTPYRENERYAAGEHPTLSTPGQGLPDWVSNDRPIADTDLVLWHTVGMHHLVRAEDWPVMPVLWHSFEIRPFDFFNRNPALDLPK